MFQVASYLKEKPTKGQKEKNGKYRKNDHHT